MPALLVPAVRSLSSGHSFGFCGLPQRSNIFSVWNGSCGPRLHRSAHASVYPHSNLRRRLRRKENACRCSDAADDQIFGFCCDLRASLGLTRSAVNPCQVLRSFPLSMSSPQASYKACPGACVNTRLTLTEEGDIAIAEAPWSQGLSIASGAGH